MRRLLFIFCLPFLLVAEDHWVAFRSGPFEVLSSAGEDAGRETLNALEQLRHGLGTVLGKEDLESVWPIRLLIFKASKENQAYLSPSLKQRRDVWTAGVVKDRPLPLRDCARILLEESTNRMPASIERGLLAVFSTLEVDKTRITLGTPVPAAERNKDWARMHLLTVNPRYSGRVRVFLFNLQQGADWTAAYKNGFESTPAKMDAEVEQYLAAGNFLTASISGRPINPERDFKAREVDPMISALALADLLDGEAARRAYQSALNAFPKSAEAFEGLGMFDEAVAAGSKSARCYLEYGRRQKEPAKAWDAYQKAAQLNPRWAEPHLRLAELEKDPARKAKRLETAAQLEPRNLGYWKALAEAYQAANQFTEAARAWAGAERAADQAEKARLREARLAFEKQRAEQEAAERKRLAEERQREIEKLKEAAMANIRAAEEEANRGEPPAPPGRKVVEWWEGQKPAGKVSGILQKVDCIRGLARLVILGDDKKITQLLIRDPSQVVVLGGGEKAMGCGPQRPPRRITVEYTGKADAKLATAGEATVIEFH